MSDEKYQEARRMLCRYIVNVAKEKGITQEQIAEKTGFTQSNISRMLAGRYSPSLENFIRLAEAVDTYFFVIDKTADSDLTETMRNRWGKIETN